MGELRRSVQAGNKLVDALRNISRRGLQALALVLIFALTIGLVRFGGMEAEEAFRGGTAVMFGILLLDALSHRR